MDGKNLRPAPAPGGEASVDQVDWRTRLQTDSRQCIVNKIMETLKRHLPFCGLQEFKKIAVRFEEEVYTAASSQPDYLRKISLKMLTLENKSHNTGPVNPASNSNRRPDTGASHSLPLQVQNQPQAHQQLVSQNVQTDMAPGGVQRSEGMGTSLPHVSGITQSPITYVVGLNSNMQNMPGISQASAGNQMGQAVPTSVFSGSQRQMLERQQIVLPQQQTGMQNSGVVQQLQQPLLKRKFQPGNASQPLMQSHIPQQQQSPLQVNQLQSSQQPGMQNSGVVQYASMNGLQQNQPLIQHSASSMLQQHQQQSVTRQRQQRLLQQNNLQNLQQQQQIQQLLHQQQLQQQLQQQQQPEPGGTGLLASQGQQSQSQALQQQLVSQMQSSATQLQHQLGLQQQSYSMQCDLQQRLQGGGQATDSLDPLAQSGQVNTGDWQEEAYQKVVQMKEKYLPELTEILQEVDAKLQELDSQQSKSDMVVKLETFKQKLDPIIRFLQMGKSSISPELKERLVFHDKMIQSFLSVVRPRKPMQQGLVIAQPKEPLPSPIEPILGCPICLGPLVKETTTRCGHVFCEKCINTALSKQSRCPTCRIPVVAGDLIRVFLGTNTSVREFWAMP